MKFENEFTVDAPVDDVWAALMDIERVTPCMPGAEVLERVSDDTYKVAVRVKVGPISMRYRGQVEVADRDDAGHRASMRAKAKEARGQGTADAQIGMRVEGDARSAHAWIDTQVQLSGKAAAMGQGVIGDVAAKLVETFAANLADMLVGAPAGVAAGASVPPRAATAARESVAPSPPADLAAPKQNGAGAGGPPDLEGAGGPGPPSSTSPPTPQRPSQDSLPIGEIAASVIAGRLANPRTLVTVLAVVAGGSWCVGYSAGRRRARRA